ncbi:(2Fe-2S)-binding protein [Streptacidiphilus monticola]
MTPWRARASPSTTRRARRTPCASTAWTGRSWTPGSARACSTCCASASVSPAPSPAATKECGACSVQVDGQLTAACLVPAALAAGVEIRTVEGLAEDGTPSDVQRALAETGAVQCGFCVPGLAMAVHDLLQRNHEPTELEARQALCGNLCRCTGYAGALAAVRKVAAARAETTAEEPATAPAQEPGTTELGETELDAAGLLDLTGPQDGELPVYVDPLTETTADVPAQHGPYDAGYDYDAYAYQPANGGYGPDDPNSTTGTFTLPTQHRPEAGA